VCAAIVGGVGSCFKNDDGQGGHSGLGFERGQGGYGGSALGFDLRLLGFLESDLLSVEESHGPRYLVRLLEQDILIGERIACSLGHCNVSPF